MKVGVVVMSNPNLVRVNTNISKKINNWLDHRSYESGISKSSLIQLALESYFNQQEAMEYLPELTKSMDKLKEMAK